MGKRGKSPAPGRPEKAEVKVDEEELEFEDEFEDEFEEEEMVQEGEEEEDEQMLGSDGVAAEVQGKLYRAGDALA